MRQRIHFASAAAAEHAARGRRLAPQSLVLLLEDGGRRGRVQRRPLRSGHGDGGLRAEITATFQAKDMRANSTYGHSGEMASWLMRGTIVA